MTPNQLRDQIADSLPEISDGDVDALRKLAMEMTDERKADPETYLRCPRCYGYHSIHGNFDNLCDSCQKTILTNFPDHPSVPFIKEALDKWRVAV